MNRQQLEGNWKQMKGRVREKWGELTDDDLDEIRGRAEVLIGKVQERYGKAREAAEQEVSRWLESARAGVRAAREEHEGGDEASREAASERTREA